MNERGLREIHDLFEDADVKRMLENTFDGFVIFDDLGVLQYANPEALRLLGVRRSEALPRRIQDLLSTDQRNLLAQAWKKVLSAKSNHRGELVIDTRDHHARVLEYKVSANIRPGIHTAFIRDLKEKRSSQAAQTSLDLAARAFQFQNALTQAITENAASSLFMMDRGGRPTYMNPAAEETTGFKLEELRDRPLHHSIHHHRPDGSLYSISECPIDLAQEDLKIRKNEEEVFIRKDGSFFPVSFSVAPIKRGENVVGSVLEFRDITEQKKSEAALNESLRVLKEMNALGQSLTSELNLEKLVQAVTDTATALTQAKFGAFFYNVKDASGESYTLYTISGVPREAFAKFPMPRNTEVFAPTFYGKALRSDDITKDPRYGKNAPYAGMPAGHLPVVSYLAVPVISRSGEVLGGLFFGHPQPGVFTAKEEELVTALASHAGVAIDNAHLYKQAREAVTVRDEFLSIASHELRTPLTPLKMQIQSLQRFLTRTDFNSLSLERLKRIGETCDRQINRLAHLVEDLLDVSRISAGRLTLNFESLNLAELIRELAERFQSEFVQSETELVLELADDLWGEWDRLRLEQVLVNLLSNALKYAPGKPVRISALEEGGFAYIKVQDHGLGISEENLPKIFDRFERVNAPDNVGGLGLGLFIAQQIVEAHHGTIKVNSALSEGSTFIVKLPMRLEKKEAV